MMHLPHLSRGSTYLWFQQDLEVRHQLDTRGQVALPLASYLDGGALVQLFPRVGHQQLQHTSRVFLWFPFQWSFHFVFAALAFLQTFGALLWVAHHPTARWGAGWTSIVVVSIWISSLLSLPFPFLFLFLFLFLLWAPTLKFLGKDLG